MFVDVTKVIYVIVDTFDVKVLKAHCNGAGLTLAPAFGTVVLLPEVRKVAEVF